MHIYFLCYRQHHEYEQLFDRKLLHLVPFNRGLYVYSNVALWFSYPNKRINTENESHIWITSLEKPVLYIKRTFIYYINITPHENEICWNHIGENGEWQYDNIKIRYSQFIQSKEKKIGKMPETICAIFSKLATKKNSMISCAYVVRDNFPWIHICKQRKWRTTFGILIFVKIVQDCRKGNMRRKQSKCVNWSEK